jgi:hypothetical protein
MTNSRNTEAAKFISRLREKNLRRASNVCDQCRIALKTGFVEMVDDNG